MSSPGRMYYGAPTGPTLAPVSIAPLFTPRAWRDERESEKGEVLQGGVGTLRHVSPPHASVQWQPGDLTMHTKKCFLGAGFLGAPPTSLREAARDAFASAQLSTGLRPWAFRKPDGVCHCYISLPLCLYLSLSLSLLFLPLPPFSVYTHTYTSLSLYIYIYIYVYIHIQSHILCKSNGPRD